MVPTMEKYGESRKLSERKGHANDHVRSGKREREIPPFGGMSLIYIGMGELKGLIMR